MRQIFLDPDGTHDLGHYVLVCAPTSVVYHQQSGGLLNLQTSAEGFLVSVGPSDAVRTLEEWFVRVWPKTAVGTTDDALVEGLRERLSSIACWAPEEGGEQTPFSLKLDIDRIAELTEAWIPVVVPYGSGYLLLKNSD